MGNTQSILKFIIQSIVAGLAIGFLIVYFKPDILTDRSSQSSQVPAPSSYAPAVNKIAPSVVSIYAQSEVIRRRNISPELQRFMGLSSLVPQSVTQQYLGSGVVMSADGYIVTNYHVIKNATQIIVSLWDNSLLEAKLIGSDSVTDIAVLKIEALHLTPATFANSDLTQTGDIVMAIGNPYGLSQSVSLGIVSAKGRSGLDVSTIENFIQTDAAINEGNSGGALINTNGNVVGISTATFNESGAQGINFAIPANATKLIMQEILQNGKVHRGWLGIELYTPQWFYRSRIIKPKQGVMVLGVYPKYPAILAGFRQGDIITHINDTEIKNRRHYLEFIAQSKPGETLEIVGFSGGKTFRKQVQTVERPAQIR
ncbi:Outer membrane stress sensor protease DegS [hydrothermal vent metagenome]|uniref:Outer membrane stress sensor protease DegS n=1 Tax=hydrothermal vent metagenome TaxID=652676 RepID=A0A3B0VEM8_9ZZZZ